MKAILLLAVLQFLTASSLALAQANDQEIDVRPRTNQYTLTYNGEKSGNLTVMATIVGEPIIAPVRFTVRLKCLPGFQSKETQRTYSWKSYAYGTSDQISLLSSFEPSAQVLTVYYRSAIITPDQYAVPDKSHTRVFKLEGICRK